MTKKLFIIGIIVAILALSNTAVIVGFDHPIDTLVFLGRVPSINQDMYPALSLIEQSKQGSWVVRNIYNHIPTNTPLFSYVIIGKFAAAMHLPSLIMWYVSRAVFSLVFLFILWHMLSFVFSKFEEKALALAVIGTASGLTFIIPDNANTTIDFYVHSLAFFSLSTLPHIILAEAILVLGFIFYTQYLVTSRLHYVILFGIVAGYLAVEAPYSLAVLFPTILIALVLKREFGIKPIAPLILTAVLVVPIVTKTLQNPFLSLWPLMTSDTSSVFGIIVWIGLEIPFVLFGTAYAFERNTFIDRLLVSWVVVVSILLFSPLTQRIFFVVGWQIPLGIFTALGIVRCIRFIDDHMKIRSVFLFNTVSACIVILVFINTLLGIKNDIQPVLADSPQSYMYHISSEEYKALLWLRDHTNNNDVVLSNWFWGNIIPGITGRRVYLGHKVLTVNFDTKVTNTNGFLISSDTKEIHRFLSETKITYIFLGVNDSMLQYGFKPQNKPFLINVYDKGDVQIYKVDNSKL